MVVIGASAIALCLAGGCGNSFASFGGTIAGDRGTIQVVIINNTANQAVFTLGTFDPVDENSQPDIVQFGTDPDQLQLPGQSTSSRFSITCGRVLGVGSSRLLGAISQNLALGDLDEAALVEGISFGDLPDDGSAISVVGSASGFEVLLGTDFSCNSLIILQLEAISLGENAFRIDFSFIPSSSDR